MEKGIPKKVRKKLKVRPELCLGCGLCALNCPQGAISLFWGKVWIDQRKCNSCGICIRVCPQGAIQEVVPVPIKDLRGELKSLYSRVDDIVLRSRD